MKPWAWGVVLVVGLGASVAIALGIASLIDEPTPRRPDAGNDDTDDAPSLAGPVDEARPEPTPNRGITREKPQVGGDPARQAHPDDPTPEDVEPAESTLLAMFDGQDRVTLSRAFDDELVFRVDAEPIDELVCFIDSYAFAADGDAPPTLPERFLPPSAMRAEEGLQLWRVTVEDHNYNEEMDFLWLEDGTPALVLKPVYWFDDREALLAYDPDDTDGTRQPPYTLIVLAPEGPEPSLHVRFSEHRDGSVAERNFFNALALTWIAQQELSYMQAHRWLVLCEEHFSIAMLDKDPISHRLALIATDRNALMQLDQDYTREGVWSRSIQPADTLWVREHALAILQAMDHPGLAEVMLREAQTLDTAVGVLEGLNPLRRAQLAYEPDHPVVRHLIGLALQPVEPDPDNFDFDDRPPIVRLMQILDAINADLALATGLELLRHERADVRVQAMQALHRMSLGENADLNPSIGVMLDDRPTEWNGLIEQWPHSRFARGSEQAQALTRAVLELDDPRERAVFGVHLLFDCAPHELIDELTDQLAGAGDDGLTFDAETLGAELFGPAEITGRSVLTYAIATGHGRGVARLQEMGYTVGVDEDEVMESLGVVVAAFIGSDARLLQRLLDEGGKDLVESWEEAPRGVGADTARLGSPQTMRVVIALWASPENYRRWFEVACDAGRSDMARLILESIDDRTLAQIQDAPAHMLEGPAGRSGDLSLLEHVRDRSGQRNEEGADVWMLNVAAQRNDAELFMRVMQGRPEPRLVLIALLDNPGAFDLDELREIVGILRSRGADLDADLRRGHGSALREACDNGRHLLLAASLLDAGADADATVQRSGRETTLRGLIVNAEHLTASDIAAYRLLSEYSLR